MVRRYVGKGGKNRNISGLVRLFTELWAGSDDGSSRPVSILRAVGQIEQKGKKDFHVLLTWVPAS